MEAIDTISVWQINEGDLIQFEAYADDERYTELLRVVFVDVQDDDGVYYRVHGESLTLGESAVHDLDPYLEVEVMGA